MDIIIWGTGKIGKMAYLYYSGSYKIRCFVDNCSEKQGTFFEGVEVCAPSVLRKERDVKLVIASKAYQKEIQEQSFREFGIKDCILFNINTEYGLYKKKYSPEQYEIVVRMAGGIGNQMFQYAFGKCLEQTGRRVAYELSSYCYSERRFILEDVFPSMNLSIVRSEYTELLPPIYEPDIKLVKEYCVDLELLKKERGYFNGYWQSYKYVDMVKEELLKDFVFPNIMEKCLREMADDIMSENSVSIHIRRGDYLQSVNKEVFSGICTEKYYEQAITYLSECVENCKFYIFTNDIDWARERYEKAEFIIVNQDMFEDYQDWYDLYLMSCCRHNIIANSSFSWWGAWLNQNKKKIVIAPDKVVNTCEVKDFYPWEWIRM